MTKDEAAAIVSSLNIDEYNRIVSGLLDWRDEQQIRVNEYTTAIDSLSADLEALKLDKDAVISAWIASQEAIINEKLDELFNLNAELKQRLDDSESAFATLSLNVATLSGAYEQIRKGKQQVLGERYEA